MIHPHPPKAFSVSYQCGAAFLQFYLSLLCLFKVTGTGPVNISHLPAGTLLSFVIKEYWKDTAVWVVCFPGSGVLFPSGSCVMHLLGGCSPFSKSQWYPDGGFLSSFPGTLVSGFLASLARTPVGSFLLASPGLWHLSEFLCHPVARAISFQQGLKLSHVGDEPLPSLFLSLVLCLSPRSSSCSLYLLFLCSLEFSSVLSS